MTLFSGFVAWLLLVTVDGSCPDASRMVAVACEAQATWHAFPGMDSEIEVEWNGKRVRGRAIVDPDGRVLVEHVPEPHRSWAAQRLEGVVRQQLPAPGTAARDWQFADLLSRAAAARLVCPTDDPFRLLHRTQDDRFQAVEVRSSRHRQRTTTLKTGRTTENKHLPAVLVLHRWNVRTSELESVETTLLTWRRIGGFDLPARIQVLSADASGDAASGQIVLSSHRLFPWTGVLAGN